MNDTRREERRGRVELPVLLGAAAAALAAAGAALLLPTPFALAVVAVIVAAELAAVGALSVTLTRRAGNVRVREALERTAAPATGPVAAAEAEILLEERMRHHDKWKARLENGFSATALEPLLRAARNPAELPEYRFRVLRTLDEWFQAEERAHRAGAEHAVDVLIVSHFGLPGGNTSANVADITALTGAGLRVGLLHHPVYRWDVAVPINPKIAALVDGERVVRVTCHDTVRADLTVVRLPTIMERLMDDLPRIETGRTVLLVNQTPFTFYGPEGGSREQWSVRGVHDTIQGWLGEHTWYTVGPEVRSTLERHHGDELEGLDIAEEYWSEIIDATEWVRPEHRPGSRPIRIGRHARDAPLKWPETPEKLLACYPDDPEFEVRSLGGARTPREMLGSLPGNWVDHPFGSMAAKEFLRELDVMVYFIAEEAVEAFGRSPLEAMAAGVPCVMDARFEPLFGDGALYCEPEEVAGVVRKLVEEPGAYEAQVARGAAKVAESFSPEALVDRVRRLGAGRDEGGRSAATRPGAAGLPA